MWGVPALATLAEGLSDFVAALAGIRPPPSVGGLLMILALSPAFSWAALLVAVPVSIAALRLGLAGWATASLIGALAGLAAYLLLDPSLDSLAWNRAILPCAAGAILGWSYRQTLFLFHRPEAQSR